MPPLLLTDDFPSPKEAFDRATADANQAHALGILDFMSTWNLIREALDLYKATLN